MSSPRQQPSEFGPPEALPYVPLSAATSSSAAPHESLGGLVGDATRHLSTLLRAEIELAKVEVTTEVKKGFRGGLFFILAGVIGLYSSFFFFFFLGELLSVWLPSWASYGIVFLLMLLLVVLLGILGYRKVKQIKAPQRTINNFKDTAAALRPHRADEPGTSAARD